MQDRDKNLDRLFWHAARSQPGSLSATILLLKLHEVNRSLWRRSYKRMRNLAEKRVAVYNERARRARAISRNHLRKQEAIVGLHVAREEAEKRKNEARAISNEQRKVRSLGELLRLRKRYEKEEKERKIRKLRAIQVAIENQGPTDLVRDILWVYENANDLIQDVDGVRVLNAKVLETAPSQGATMLAEYARDDLRGFLDKYALKMLPKNAAEELEKEAAEQAAEEKKRMEELDPQFDDLNDYITGGD